MVVDQFFLFLPCKRIAKIRYFQLCFFPVIQVNTGFQATKLSADAQETMRFLNLRESHFSFEDFLSVFLKYSEQSYLRKFARNSVKLFVSYRHMKNSRLKREYFPKVCFFSYFIESGFFLSVAYLMVANLARLKISVHCQVSVRSQYLVRIFSMAWITGVCWLIYANR